MLFMQERNQRTPKKKKKRQKEPSGWVDRYPPGILMDFLNSAEHIENRGSMDSGPVWLVLGVRVNNV